LQRLADPGVRRAERACTRAGGANPGAIRWVFGCRNPGVRRFPKRVPVRPPDPKAPLFKRTENRFEPPAESPGRRSLSFENWRRVASDPPGKPTMTDRRRRGQAISVRFRSGAADSSAGSRFPKREAPRYETCRNREYPGLFRGRIPELNSAGLTSKITGPALR
jgi:hypothetical protein